MTKVIRLNCFVSSSLFLASGLFFLCVASPAVFAQVFSAGGSELHADEDTEFDLEFDLASDDPDAMTAIFIPAQGRAIARVRVVDGTEVTRYSARRIEYSVADGGFLLQGNARIEQEQGYLFGPTKIEFSPERNLMLVVGTKEAPAEIDYPLRNNRFWGRAVEFHFHFVIENGSRVLKNIKSEGNLGWRVTPDTVSPSGSAPMRRISPPSSGQ